MKVSTKKCRLNDLSSVPWILCTVLPLNWRAIKHYAMIINFNIDLSYEVHFKLTVSYHMAYREKKTTHIKTGSQWFKWVILFQINIKRHWILTVERFVSIILFVGLMHYGRLFAMNHEATSINYSLWDWKREKIFHTKNHLTLQISVPCVKRFVLQNVNN